MSLTVFSARAKIVIESVQCRARCFSDIVQCEGKVSEYSVRGRGELVSVQCEGEMCQ